MKNKKRSAATSALRVLDRAGIAYELIEYEHSAVMEHGFALDTVAVLGLNPDEVFKTLLAEADGRPVVGVVPASHHMNLKSLAKAVDAKHAEMMEPTKAERLTGYITGGISPIGQRTLYPTIIDESAESLTSMVISGGKRSLSIRIAPGDLVELLGARMAPIAALR